MLKVPARICKSEEVGAWITCLWMAAGVILPVVTIAWKQGSSHAWLWEAMCFILWAGLFWWAGEPSQRSEAAAYAAEAVDEEDRQEQAEHLLEKYISRKN
ncbi:MAG: hypothetical protein P4N41_17130 [Negativicutes bacterium]|nr:hypothetical protein [Negativicutes bacterium]